MSTPDTIVKHPGGDKDAGDKPQASPNGNVNEDGSKKQSQSSKGMLLSLFIYFYLTFFNFSNPTSSKCSDKISASLC